MYLKPILFYNMFLDKTDNERMERNEELARCAEKKKPSEEATLACETPLWKCLATEVSSKRNIYVT